MLCTAADTAQYVFACSHGGDVMCINGRSGAIIWQANLPGHLNSGLTLCHSLKVPPSAQLDEYSLYDPRLLFQQKKCLVSSIVSHIGSLNIRSKYI